uniref:Uncharacterized protein n=1 Tax=Manihot esculenta TaxID=3983 RepID=A0A2C9VWJ8_MANES
MMQLSILQMSRLLMSGSIAGRTPVKSRSSMELADTSTSRALASKLPTLEGTLTNKAKAGKTLSVNIDVDA